LSRFVLCFVLGSIAAGLAACGGSSNETPATQPAASSCEDVSLGTFEGQTWSATKIEAAGVDCDEAQEVAGQWAAQQVGGPNAKLPAGWHCSHGCRKGSARVSFTLGYEG
jgi:hypothetical protein